MTWIRVVDESEADGELARLYGLMADPGSGRVDHVLTCHSLHPAGLAAHFELYRAVMKGTRSLPRVDRELIAVTVSRINECHY